MTLPRIMGVLAVVTALSPGGLADVVVHEWNGYSNPNDYDVPFGSYIRIKRPSYKAPPDDFYDFECCDNSDPNEPAAQIDGIVLHPLFVGSGNLDIAGRGHDPHRYGASTVVSISLEKQGVTSTIRHLRIKGALADGGGFMSQQ